jgi:hypothetical protein
LVRNTRVQDNKLALSIYETNLKNSAVKFAIDWFLTQNVDGFTLQDTAAIADRN